jgi:hypothetical protein
MCSCASRTPVFEIRLWNAAAGFVEYCRSLVIVQNSAALMPGKYTARFDKQVLKLLIPNQEG